MNNSTARSIFESVAMIVSCEEKIIEHYNEDEMKTPMHMSMGDENCVAGVSECFRDCAYFLGYYRTHSLYLSLTKDPYRFFAELYGKASGSNGGIAGSMHMSSKEHGLLSTSAIVGSTIPLSLGAAFAAKMKGEKKCSVVFFGDGAMEEGVFFETLNMACLYKLPVIFVCLDNGLAVDIEARFRQGYDSLRRLIESYDCKYLTLTDASALAVYDIAEEAKNLIVNQNGPCFLHLKYYRYLQHIGITNDFEHSANAFESSNYRSKDEYETALANMPLTKTLNDMLALGFEASELFELQTQLLRDVNASQMRVLSDQFQTLDTLNTKVLPN